jgi:hypothetical protein
MVGALQYDVKVECSKNTTLCAPHSYSGQALKLGALRTGLIGLTVSQYGGL